MLACGLLAACSGIGQPSSIPQTSAIPDPQVSNAPSIVATPIPAVTTPTPAASPTPIATPVASAASKRFSHVTVVIMENYNYSQVMSGSSPYIHSLASSNALFTNSFGVSHPSEPNYDALYSGSTEGLASDACPISYNVPTLASELAAKGLSFAGYAEDNPNTGACSAVPSSSVGSGALYWRKHAPWQNFTNPSPSSVSHTYNGPGTPLTGAVNFVVPNVCNDMHDCSIATGDAWLAKNIPAILSYENANNGLLILTFDEGDNDPNNHIVTIMAGPMVKPGTYTQAINHYSVLRLIEDNFGVPLLGNSANAAPITGAF